ncbi:hypothetical protein QE364_002450 [Nocardioides zeae]|uniref:Uncharacterized protein n=1 Tax=Nocardioides zeae TaxID=1457234 RepID=A0ACC6IJH7_9ACTN|nr:hypothetical protein [Nocardioides zeae]MDR6174666.1 hypothetical protein [Nocardioides zeae]MDR6210735.1 hypothetical protein [Nocardioides zeae]
MKPGTRLHSTVSEASVVVVRPGTSDAFTCGGQPMAAEPSGVVGDGGASEQLVIGKRYVDEKSGVEVLCVKGGAGPLAVDGRVLAVKSAKQLPASD